MPPKPVPMIATWLWGTLETDGSLRDDEVQDGFSPAVAEVIQNRAIIEQAKGMLMFVYGIDADGAFDLLRWLSQQNNVKLRLLAERIAQDLTTAAQERPPVNRPAFDELILTAPARVTAQR
jgi:ANTAR domain